MAKLGSNLLDDLTIKAAKPSDKPNPLRDGGGLYLLVNGNGSKYFQLRATLHGKRKLIQLGVYPKITLADARAMARDMLSQIKTNVDPVLLRKKTKLGKAIDADNTFQKVASDWLLIKGRSLAKSSHKKIQQTFNANVFGMIGKYPIKDVDNVMVRNCLLVMQKRGSLELMEQTRSWIKAVFDFAFADGLLLENPIPVKDIRLEVAVSKGYPHLKSLADAGTFLRNLAKYRGSFEVATCTYLCLHLAQRPTELRDAKWVEFDLDNSLWTLPLERSKTRKHMAKAHTIVLSRQVIARLRELQVYSGHSEYLFPSRVKDKALSEATIRKCFRAVFTKYHTVPHGCRHFFITQTNESLLFNRDVIEVAVSHGDKDRVRATYNFATYEDERRRLFQWWSDQLEDAKESRNS